MTFLKEIREHKWMAARGVLTGWALWTFFILWIFPFFVGGNIGVALTPSDPIGTAWTVLTAPVGIQANLSRPFSFALAAGLPLIVWAICGWVVARSHRDQQTSVVLLLVGSMLFLYLLAFVFRGGFVPQLIIGPLLANAAASIAGLLLGGLLLRGRLRMLAV